MNSVAGAGNVSDSLLRVVNLSFSVGGKVILAGVSFAMRQGEIRAVIGPNGAGKSTLARCLTAVIGGASGRVEFFGRELGTIPRRELARLACYLPQSHPSMPAYTVRDYVLMGRYAHIGFWAGPGSEDRERAEDAMRMTGVLSLAERTLPTLSGGERQLVAIAAGLAQEARLLILDEPATFLDPGHQDLLLRLIRRLNEERGVSVLIVTHDVNMALRFTHWTLALRGGGVVFDCPSPELSDPGRLREIYGVDFAFVEKGGSRFALTAGMLDGGARI